MNNVLYFTFTCVNLILEIDFFLVAAVVIEQVLRDGGHSLNLPTSNK